MAGVKLEWAQFGRVDSFNVYRSESNLDFNNLPVPIATGIKFCEYWDASAERFKTYFYTVGAVVGVNTTVSLETISIFTVNNDFVFNQGDSYVAPVSPNVNFVW